MSKLFDVMRDKNRIQREVERKRNESIRQAKEDSLYNIRLNEDLRIIDTLFDDYTITEIRVEIDQKDISRFMRATYGDRMSEYDIIVKNNMAYIRRKSISL